MNKVIRRLKKIMGFDGESEPILKEGQEEFAKPKAKVKLKMNKKAIQKEVEETKREKLERELEELKETEIAVEKSKEAEEVEEQRLPTQEEINLSHEQRILQMEAKWFRLGGI